MAASKCVLLFALFACAFVYVQAGVREENDKCANCRIAFGFGYNRNNDDCSCYWKCKREHKKIVSYKMCCPCNMAWSQRKMTCVKVNSRWSTCLQNPGSNPCTGQAEGDKLTRPIPDALTGDLCSSYYECTTVNSVDTTLYPMTMCCEDDEMFDGTTCVNDAADTCKAKCCEKKRNIKRITEQACPFVAIGDSNPRQFMLKFGGMNTYTCPRNTVYKDCVCWQTGSISNVCDVFEANFNNDRNRGVSTTDGQVYMEVVNIGKEDGGPNPADPAEKKATFPGIENQYINVPSYASRPLGGRTGNFGICMYVSTKNASDSIDQSQSLLSNCLDPTSTDATLSMCLDRDNDGKSAGLTVSMTKYKNANRNENDCETKTGTVTFTPIDDDQWFQVCVFYWIKENAFIIGVLNEDGTNVLAADEIEFTDSDSAPWKPSKSGMLFGYPGVGKEPFVGCLDYIRIINCKPRTGIAGFDEHEAILAFLAANP